jgi:hypothetical protein
MYAKSDKRNIPWMAVFDMEADMRVWEKVR